MKIYTDKPKYLKKKYGENVYDIKNFDGSENSVFLIFNQEFNLEEIYHKGFVITAFKSKLSDFELNQDNNLKSKLDYILKLINGKTLKIEKTEEKNKNEDISDVKINKIDSFGGIYVNNILIKRGNVRFISLFEVILSVFRQKHSGKIKIKQRNNIVYELSFNFGILTSINSFLESDNFQYFLKKFGYVSDIDQGLLFYSPQMQLDIYLDDNGIFKNERELIYKDYIIFLFRNITELKKGDFEITSEEPLFDEYLNTGDYLSFLFNFVRYLKPNPLKKAIFEIKVEKPFEDKDLNEFVILIRKYKDSEYLLKIFDDEDYFYKLVKFLEYTGFLEVKDSKEVIIKSSVNENIEKRIKLWTEKIKNENYFDLLGVNFNDSNEFIKEKYLNLVSQFGSYLSSEELRKQFENELNDIIFELESAFKVLINRKLKKSYYEKMLK